MSGQGMSYDMTKHHVGDESVNYELYIQTRRITSPYMVSNRNVGSHPVKTVVMPLNWKITAVAKAEPTRIQSFSCLMYELRRGKFKKNK